MFYLFFTNEHFLNSLAILLVINVIGYIAFHFYGSEAHIFYVSVGLSKIKRLLIIVNVAFILFNIFGLLGVYYGFFTLSNSR